MADTEISIRWPDDYEAIPSNAVRVARVHDHVEVLFGYIPVSTITDMISGNRPAGTVDIKYAAGAFMSAVSFNDFYHQVKRIHDAMVEAGEIDMGATQ